MVIDNVYQLNLSLQSDGTLSGRRAAALVMSGFAAQRLQETDQSASDSLSADSVSLSTPGLSTCALRNTWRPSAGWGGGDGECLGPFHVRVIARGLLRHKWLVPLVDPPNPSPTPRLPHFFPYDPCHPAVPHAPITL